MPVITLHDQLYAYTLAGSGPPLLLLHGFTGCADNWQPLIRHLAPRFTCLAVDLLGHGQSASPDDVALYRMEACLTDLVALLEALHLPAVHLLGYSMGGRVALSFAVAHPERVLTLTLESASPGLQTEAERAARRASDEALADRLEREGLEAFVNYWENLPLFATQKNLPETTRAQLRAQRLRNNPRGLAHSLRGLGTGVQPSLWEHLSNLHIPTLLLTGALDVKFTAIAQDMNHRLPNAQHITLPNTGHTLHLEAPNQFFSSFIIHPS